LKYVSKISVNYTITIPAMGSYGKKLWHKLWYLRRCVFEMIKSTFIFVMWSPL
jgi:hypothetical protein